MNEDKQIATIISAAKSAPRKVGVFIDDYKEERFVKKLRAGLPEAEFEIEVIAGLTPKTKSIIITKRVQVDPAAN